MIEGSSRIYLILVKDLEGQKVNPNDFSNVELYMYSSLSQDSIGKWSITAVDGYSQAEVVTKSENGELVRYVQFELTEAMTTAAENNQDNELEIKLTISDENYASGYTTDKYKAPFPKIEFSQN